MNSETSAFSKATQDWIARGRYVTLGGRKIFVFEQGAGPVLLLLHGFPTSCFDWRGVSDRLRDRFRCVAFDFPGYGLSDKPEAYSYSLFQQADTVEELARELGIREAHVVSHDMGTSVHCELLARASGGTLGFRIAKSTITNGSMLQWLAKITPFQVMLASNETLPRAMELCAAGLPGHVPALRALMKHPDAWTAEDATVIEEMMAYQEGHRRLPAIAGYMRERYVHRDRWIGALGQSQESLQFVWATEDPIATAEMGRELHRLFPKARFTELPGLGHFLIAEDPERVARGIESFA